MRASQWLLGLSLAFLASCAGCGSKQCTSTADCDVGQVCSAGRCQAAGTGGGSGDGGTDAGTGGGNGGGTGGGTGGGSAQVQVVRLEVTPAMSTLQSTNGSQPVQVFAVTAFFNDNTSRAISDADFTVDLPAIGEVGPIGGPFTASGLVGGLATVTASYTQGATVAATATVLVQLDQTFAPVGAPTDLPTRFAGTPVVDPVRAADLVYPLDGVVFPQNVAPADIQWLNGTTGDWFRVRMAKPDIAFTTYVQDDGQHHFVPDPGAWRALAQTNPLSSATLDVTRLETTTSELIGTPQRLMRFANASLVGSIYYWDIARGRIVRIDDGTTTRTEFMPTPPESLQADSCVGCHAVSPSGRYMAGRLGGGDNIGGIFDLTTSLLAAPAPTVWALSRVTPETPRWWFSSFSPDERRLVISQNESAGSMRLNFLDPATGLLVPVSNIPQDRATHPSWSPDGMKIAYVNLANAGEWGGLATQGDIKVVSLMATDTLGASTTVHVGSSLSAETPGGTADTYPTWTPDSNWLAFAHGTDGRSETGQSALYLMKGDGSEVRRLTRASGGMSAVDTFQPRFSPFRAGGYFWMSFLSRRDYGNTQIGTRGANRQQIWVAAIRENPQSGVDPSEVGYWLPGQNTASQNIAAYWAPRPCRPANASCSVGSECCSGDCRMSGGALQCSPPPPERCRRLNETCGGTGDCCPNQGLVCLQNVCIPDIQ